ncbi:MAG: hypothetical protein EA352_04185 [Gemmatimonadales bacterium]|nr:MAG: hypothetical protein EA352_04185 [Gemmatimonadales bacterium]
MGNNHASPRRRSTQPSERDPMNAFLSLSGRILALLLVLTLPLAAQDAEEGVDDRPGVAILPFTDGGSFGADREDLAALSVGLQQILITELQQNSQLRIVDRSVLREVLEEQDLAEEGRVDAATAARVGQIVGARYVVTGGYMDLSGDFRLDARIVDGETTETPWSDYVRGDRSDLYALLVDMAGKITSGADLPALPMEVREEREARPIPPQAITLYSRAQVLQDVGQTDRARELYQRIVSDFPEMTEAGEALEQLDGEA